ncbi:aldo/keto reductase family protein [Spirochaeta isovalerica]|uniref:Voltage-dependent potassium channel beta subunit n=1 Tax=Spirochaeta isovalerica TaxID=150 RepID=A0A841R7E3_9SPIO|nr:aldo/keto reductase family protein [Spirochaeta isovalerica]MBB6478960.1 voltage-dependent potassium channel beta subunit [Spirochaeta isovalerica]
MKYRKLGNTGLSVSEIAYGSWLTFANQVELDKAKKIINRAIELGINYFDSADAYEKGKAEELLGEILPQRKRSQYVVATKAYWPQSEHETDKGLSRKHVIDSIHLSLDRLKLKYVDLFYCHRYDTETPLIETLEAIEDMIRQGKILYWGTSEWTAEQIAEAHKICTERQWHLPVVNQPLYNLLARNIEKEILPKCVELGMGTCNFSPLAQGVLTGKYSGGKVPAGSRGSNDRQNMWMKDQIGDIELLNRVDSLGEIAKKYNLTIGQLSLAWILQNPGISSVIVGATSIEQLESNAAASGVVLETGDYEKMNSLFPVG